MKRQCAWCGVTLGEGLDSEEEVTHGICEPCAQFFLNADEQEMTGFLNHLPFPVMLVDSDVRVIDGNDAGLKLLGKSRGEVVGYLGGQVAECAYAKLPGGCGKTEHCSGCVLRRSATHTHTSGEPVIDAPCEMHRVVSGVDQVAHFMVSTRRVGEAVFLKLAPAGSGRS